jgi:PAS domain S-box-containing protein
MTAEPIAILVADDEAASRIVLCAALRKFGFNVTETVNGHDALQKFRERPHDVVMLAAKMSGTTGLEVCATLRAEGEELLPIVIIAATDEVDAIETAYRVGATDCIRKPANGPLVCYRLKYLLRNYKAMLDLRAAEARTAAILSAMPDLLFEVDMEGRYIDYHSPRTELLIEPAGSFIGKTIHETLPSSAAETCMAAMRAAHVHGWSTGAQIELQLTHGTAWFELSVARKAGDSQKPPHFIVISRDITERRRAEEALRASETRLRTIVETEPVCVKLVDAAGKLLEMNSAGLSMLEADSVDAVNDHGLLNFVCPEYQAAYDALHRRVIDGESGALEFAVIGSKGTRRWLHTHAVPMRDATASTTQLLAITRDITEQKHLQRALIEASDREQRRLGHELHDGLGQDLTGISMLTAALASSAEKAGLSIAGELARLGVMTRQAINTCRVIARGLSPVSEATGGVVHALRNMVERQRDAYGADVQFETVTAAPIRLQAHVQDHLFRIAQEAVTNARKHGRAKLVKVTLDVERTQVRLEVLDDGVGLVPGSANATGMGLKIMRYRAAAIGALLSIAPGNRGGTLLVCQCLQPD